MGQYNMLKGKGKKVSAHLFGPYTKKAPPVLPLFDCKFQTYLFELSPFPI